MSGVSLVDVENDVGAEKQGGKISTTRVPFQANRRSGSRMIAAVRKRKNIRGRKSFDQMRKRRA